MVTLVTGLGDAALLLPSSAVLLLYLLQARSWRAAAGWVAALALCAGLTVLAKMMFHACGGQIPALAIRSPSGHTSLSTTFYGCGALMLSADQRYGRRLAVLLASAGLIVAIAASRVALHAHTIEEVAAGLAIGALCVALYAAHYLPRAMYALDWRMPAVVIVALALLTHGRHLNAERFLDRLTDHLRLAQYVCPLREDVAVNRGPSPLDVLASQPHSDTGPPFTANVERASHFGNQIRLFAEVAVIGAPHGAVLASRP